MNSNLQAFLAITVAAAGLPGRALLEATEAPVVSIVEKVEDLITALQEGAAHIEIREHLDTTGFPLVPALIYDVEFLHLLPPQISRTRSIRVRLSHTLMLQPHSTGLIPQSSLLASCCSTQSISRNEQ